jgi:hypothetical protein
LSLTLNRMQENLELGCWRKKDSKRKDKEERERESSGKGKGRNNELPSVPLPLSQTSQCTRDPLIPFEASAGDQINVPSDSIARTIKSYAASF